MLRVARLRVCESQRDFLPVATAFLFALTPCRILPVRRRIGLSRCSRSLEAVHSALAIDRTPVGRWDRVRAAEE